MSRKSKGECTCKIVAQNERGMLGRVRDSVYRGVKYYGEDGQVEKRFCFPRKLAEEKWLAANLGAVEPEAASCGEESQRAQCQA